MKKEQMNHYLGTTKLRLIEAMQKIDENAKGILFIVDENGHLEGTLTDGDIRRGIIKTGDLNSEVLDFMNKNPKYLYRKDANLAQEYMYELKITAMPILNMQNRISDIVFSSESTENDERESQNELENVPLVIMAGGKGTRLYPYTKILPKPLIPIGDIPIMERIINRFTVHGIRDIYAILNYRKNMIISYFSEQRLDVDIHYVEENEPLGTAGGLKLIDKKMETPFFLTNCDVLIKANYSDIYKYHIENGNEITMVVAMKNIVVPYGVVCASEHGMVVNMEEKPTLSYLINTGLYVLNPEVLNDIPENTFFHMTDLTNRLLECKRKVGMYPISEDSFLDMGEFEEMRRMEEKLNGN